MKQFIVDQMKEYQRKKEIVKAVKYEEGMEDGWLIKILDISEMDEYVDKVFYSKEEADNFIETDDFNKYKHGCEEVITTIVPVMLRHIYDELVECFSDIVTIDNAAYEFEEIEDDMWIVMDEDGDIMTVSDFFDDYEPISNNPIDKEQASVHIGYDRDLEDLYMEYSGMSRINISIDKSEVSTVEKVLDALKIPYTEKLGEFLLLG